MKNTDMEALEQIKAICDGIEYSRDVPSEAKDLAKEHSIVIVVGGSDDLMYCYGAKCYLTVYEEHSYGWGGDTLKDISDKDLEKEAGQLGLMIWWCGHIVDDGLKIEGYDSDKNGGFSYSVKDGIKALDFLVMENDGDVYCTGKIVKLPDDFESALKEYQPS